MAARFNVVIKVEGVGPYLSSSDLTASGSDARYRWCLFDPDSPDVASLWRDYLLEPPELLSERIDPLGGFPELGALSFSLLDADDDFVTGLLRIEAAPATFLAEDVDRTETAIDVSNGTVITAAGDVIWVGREAMRVTAASSNTLTVSRGYLGTRAQLHDSGAYVYRYPRELRGRRVDVTVQMDGTDYRFGTFRLDRVSWDHTTNFWRFEARSFSASMHTTAPPDPARTGVFTILEDSQATIEPHRVPLSSWQQWADDSSHDLYVRIGSEIAEVRSVTAGTTWQWGRRGLVGTSRSEVSQGDLVQQVLVAEVSGPCSFRWSPPTASTDRTSGTWTKSAHWVDLVLCILTSSPDSDDDTWITYNYDASFGNWASLPPGYGLGIAASDIDWDAWLDAKARTWGARFPNFVYGHEPKPLVEVLNDQILRPIGAVVTMGTDGKLRPILPRLPLLSDSYQVIEWTRIVADSFQVTREESHTTGRVVYEVGPQGLRFTVQNRLSVEGDRTEILTAPGADPRAAHWVPERAMARLYRLARPPWRIACGLDLPDWVSVSAGTGVAITHTQLPDLTDGTRGWSEVPAELLSRAPTLRDDQPRLDAELVSYGPGLRAATIPPAAHISSVSGNTATVIANRYTESDATGDLPATDAAGFAAGDVVALHNRDGTGASGSVQTIVTISGNDITLDGDFGGALAGGLILAYADSVTASDTQVSTKAYFAERTNRTVGATSIAPYQYAER